MNNILLPLTINNDEMEIKINHVYCIGYAGRNTEKTMEHIIELEKIGVPRPKDIPALYPVRRNSLNQTGEIEVLGSQSSGEAEIVLIFGDNDDEVYITVGSDHTDRSLETIDINQSKQICDKPIAKKAWKLNEVVNHWDDLLLTSQILVNGEWQDYQRAKINEIIPLNEIKNFLTKKDVPMKNSVIFSGTVPLLDGFKYGSGFKMVFVDKVREDKIEAAYTITRIDREE
ncbi:DUF2848 family protein [Neobacillus mesonae]|uniref:DUF2848 domain-containing protein n=1 Tax=Neobacillus mesonae TaxID=1193713 RepID=A0A3Q9QY79_9BACI|nr:DUF2848 family protein [Neobacillus mesonae]AZU64397.1 hypothetical protein CHR53_25940 [Neobacillus mesonae]MED4203514.1 DUF2848 family protein [Neobacillus mesonae]